MVVVCRTCSATYHIPDEILGGEICRFRCARCGHSWDIQPRPTLAGSLAPFRGGAAPAAGTATRKISPLRRFGAGVRRLAAAVACAAALAGAMAAVAARAEIVAAVPATGGLYAAIGLPVNSVGLAIADVSARLGAGGDKSLLAVEGAVVNLRGRETAAPNLRIALRAADGRELYVWTTRPPKDRLAPGERAPFVARLAAPPPGVVDALVKFVAPGDKDSLAPEG
jgi:predicted Zn finger-like uncharacterized protein